MAEGSITFEHFLNEVYIPNREFVTQIHERLLQMGCKLGITQAKSGYVASYTLNKKTIMNYVFRKSGMIARIYGDNIDQYLDLLSTLPDSMIKAIDKAPICKRLVDPTKCNSRCAMGYTFTLCGNDYQKCRYNAFMFLINEQSMPFIRSLIEREVNARLAV